MASPYAKLHGQSLWEDSSDFRNLPKDDQRVYFVLTTQPNISHCGLLPYNPRRWAQLAPDETVEALTEAMDHLAARRYIVIDENTDELWVRSWMKYDGLLQIHNGAKGIERAIGSVLSTGLREQIKSAAFGLAKEKDRSLFEAPPKPHVFIASNTYTNDNTNSNDPLPVEGDDFDQAIAAALEIRRGETDVRSPEAWEPRTRELLTRDYGRAIRRLLDNGHIPSDAARIALRPADEFNPRPSTAEPAHDVSCICDGTGKVLANPDDESRTSPVIDCPGRPGAVVVSMQRNAG